MENKKLLVIALLASFLAVTAISITVFATPATSDPHTLCAGSTEMQEMHNSMHPDISMNQMHSQMDSMMGSANSDQNIDHESHHK